jgi:hypothetical protein
MILNKTFNYSNDKHAKALNLTFNVKILGTLFLYNIQSKQHHSIVPDCNRIKVTVFFNRKKRETIDLIYQLYKQEPTQVCLLNEEFPYLIWKRSPKIYFLCLFGICVRINGISSSDEDICYLMYLFFFVNPVDFLLIPRNAFS